MKRKTIALLTNLGMLVLATFLLGTDTSRSSPNSSGSRETGIAAMAWDDSNIEYLRAMESPDDAGDSEVVQFVCQEDPVTDTSKFSPQYVATCGMGQFTWADLAGNHEYHLVIASYYLDATFRNWLRIYSRDSSGRITKQEIGGYWIRLGGVATPPISPKRIYTVLQDLSGNGKVELVIYDKLGSGGELPLWPKVYTLKNGKYIESSKEFATFYDAQILPSLDLALGKEPKEAIQFIGTLSPPRFGIGEMGQPEEEVVGLKMVRDKILRVLGRDPSAGQQQAREWMTSPDPELRHDAVVVFQDMGGHAADLAEAKRMEKELTDNFPANRVVVPALSK